MPAARRARGRSGTSDLGREVPGAGDRHGGSSSSSRSRIAGGRQRRGGRFRDLARALTASSTSVRGRESSGGATTLRIPRRGRARWLGDGLARTCASERPMHPVVDASRFPSRSALFLALALSHFVPLVLSLTVSLPISPAVASHAGESRPIPRPLYGRNGPEPFASELSSRTLTQ